jgi:hypothetical protein
MQISKQDNFLGNVHTSNFVYVLFYTSVFCFLVKFYENKNYFTVKFRTHMLENGQSINNYFLVFGHKNKRKFLYTGTYVDLAFQKG